MGTGTTLLKVGLVLLAALVALSVLGFALGLLTMLVEAVVSLLALAALLYGAYWLLMRGRRTGP
ncbi:hypothetical protein [Halegenticoccus tardaugens]|uniref:hypothetical protein n=1 Tax=Halegenticoccus tardaugens TaxID=2071624 RepID=UPI00100A3AC7|nr:hypothetical protein [Halegenticoccus tardaugens]